jgi:hypothetical protein
MDRLETLALLLTLVDESDFLGPSLPNAQCGEDQGTD